MTRRKKPAATEWLSTALFVLFVTVPPALVTTWFGLGSWATALLTFTMITFISQHVWQVE